MKNLPTFLCSLACLAFALIALPSCVVYEESGHSSARAYPSNYGYAQRPTHYRDDRSYSPYQQHRSPFYDNHQYARNRQYDRFDHHYAHHGHRHDDHHDDHARHNVSKPKPKPKPKQNLKHHPNSYRIAGGSTGSKTKPKGYHSISWYKSRGYDVNKLNLKTESGKTYKKSSSKKKKKK